MDWQTTLFFLTRLGAAFLLALPIAWEREMATRALGLRTFPLVAVASCGYVLVGTAVVGDHPDAQSRIINGLMTGMGFIGGGAILKHGISVRGTATAASIWTTGAIGAAVAYGSFEIAIVIALITFVALAVLTPLERMTGLAGDRLGERENDGEDDDGEEDDAGS